MRKKDSENLILTGYIELMMHGTIYMISLCRKDGVTECEGYPDKTNVTKRYNE